MTLEQANNALREICARKFNNQGGAVFDVLKSMGAASLTDLPAEQWPDVIEKVENTEA